MFELSEIQKFTDSKIIGGFLYGSRVFGHAREDSDIDACFIVDGSGENYREVHGPQCISGNNWNVEFSFITFESLTTLIREDIIFQYKILEGMCFLNSSVEEAAKKLANNFIEEHRFALVTQINNLNVHDIFHVFQVSFNEGLSVLNDQRLKANPLAYLCRLTEYISSYFLYGQLIQLQSKPSLLTDNLLKTLLIMKYNNSLRIFDTNKFVHLATFHQLIDDINSIFNTNSITDSHIFIWQSLERHFNKTFNLPLAFNEVNNELRIIR